MDTAMELARTKELARMELEFAREVVRLSAKFSRVFVDIDSVKGKERYYAMVDGEYLVNVKGTKRRFASFWSAREAALKQVDNAGVK